MCNPLPEHTSKQRIVKATLAAAMEEGIVGAMIEINSLKDVHEGMQQILSTVSVDLRSGNAVTILIIPDEEGNK